MKRAPRWWRYLRAKLGGYFWLSCEICGEPFGGQELCGSVPIRRNRFGDVGTSRSICVLCAIERQEFLENHSELEGAVLGNMRTTHHFPHPVGVMTEAERKALIGVYGRKLAAQAAAEIREERIRGHEERYRRGGLVGEEGIAPIHNDCPWPPGTKSP